MNGELRFEPMTAAIGATVTGIDLAAPLDDAGVDALHAGLMTHQVLVIPDQDLSPAAHVALGEALGPLAPRHPMYPHVDGFERILVIRNDADHPPENEEWHSDLSCRPDPPRFSVLHGKEIPVAGGDTLFASMGSVYDALSVPMQRFLAGLTALHDFHAGFKFVDDDFDAERAAALRAQDRGTNQAVHPVILTHPVTGRPTVYVNESFTLRINELDPAESRAVLAYLCAMVTRPRHQVRVRWRANTVVIWDNLAVQHYACGDHYPARRVVQRVTVVGDHREPAKVAAIPAA